MPISKGISLLLRGVGVLLRNIAAFLTRLADKSDRVGSAIGSSRAVPSPGPESIGQVVPSGQGMGTPTVGESERLDSREGAGDQRRQEIGSYPRGSMSK
jgi:hypothetical protein